MIDLLIPAAGDSARFTKGTPKAFIQFGDPPAMMWEHAISSLTVKPRINVVTRHGHLWAVKQSLPTNFPYNLIPIESSCGQADTILQGIRSPVLANREDREILIVNCDAGFKSRTLDALVGMGRFGLPSALCFEAPNAEEMRWSWVNDAAPDGMVHGGRLFDRAAEKRKFTGINFALAGAYYFPSRFALEKALQTAIDWIKPFGGEPYLSHAFEHLPGLKRVVPMKRSEWIDWGTQKQFDDYLLRNEEPLS